MSGDFKYIPSYERMKKFLMSYNPSRRVCECYMKDLCEGIIKPEEYSARERMYIECQVRCREVRAFIDSLYLTDDEKAYLAYRYLSGLTAEAVADKLYVSRSSVFRIAKRAEERALPAFIEYEGRQSA